MMQRRLAAERAEANEGSNSSGSYNTLSPAQQAALHAWVGHAIRPGTGRTSAGRMSSYGLKHCFERSPGVLPHQWRVQRSHARRWLRAARLHGAELAVSD